MKKIALSVVLLLCVAPIVATVSQKNDEATQNKESRFVFNLFLGMGAGVVYELIPNNKKNITEARLHIAKSLLVSLGEEGVNQAVDKVMTTRNKKEYRVIKPNHEYDVFARGMGRTLVASLAPAVRAEFVKQQDGYIEGKNQKMTWANLINSDLIIAGLWIAGEQLSSWYRGKPEEQEKQLQEKTELVLKYQPDTTVQPKKVETVVAPIVKPLESELERLQKQLKPKDHALTDTERKEHDLSNWWDWE